MKLTAEQLSKSKLARLEWKVRELERGLKAATKFNRRARIGESLKRVRTELTVHSTAHALAYK